MRALFSLLVVVRKELTQTLRDRRMVFTLILAPALQLVFFGYAVDFEVDRIPTIVCDQDDTPESRRLTRAFFADGTFVDEGVAADPDEAVHALETGRVAVALIVPPQFAVRTRRRTDPEVQVLVDGTDATRAQVASSWASQFLQLHGIGGRPMIPPVAPRVLFNERLASAVYMLPGIAASLLLNVTAIMTAMGLAREREAGTLEQILVTPLRPAVLLAGKCIPFILFALVDIGAVIVLGSLVFHVPIRGSIAVIGVGAFLYFFSTLGIGIMLATLSASQQQAILGAFSFMLPAMLLSGFMSPIESMPEWLQLATLLNPMRHFIEIMRGCLLKGAGVRELFPQLAALLLIGSTVLSISVVRFRKQLA